MEYKNSSALKRVEHSEEILQDNSCWSKSEKAKGPGHSQKREKSCCCLGPSTKFANQRFVLEVFVSHHFVEDQNQNNHVDLLEQNTVDLTGMS